MANNPTTNKQLNRPDYNDQNWNTPLNADFTIIDQCLGNTVQPTNVSNTYTLSSTDIQSMRVNVSGTLTGVGTVTVPPTYGGFWIVSNNTSGAFSLSMKVTTQNTSTNPAVELPQGYSTFVFSDGVNCYSAIDSKLNVTGGIVAGNLTVNNGTLAIQASSVSKLTFNPAATTPNLNVTGTITASGNITAFSDERLKKNINTIEDALQLCGSLRGVRFEDEGGTKYIGLIAQEVQKTVPEIVVKNEGNEYLSVAYGNLVGLLVNAVNELRARVEYLESK